jgi:hypothetical protein
MILKKFPWLRPIYHKYQLLILNWSEVPHWAAHLRKSGPLLSGLDRKNFMCCHWTKDHQMATQPQTQWVGCSYDNNEAVECEFTHLDQQNELYIIY